MELQVLLHSIIVILFSIRAQMPWAARRPPANHGFDEAKRSTLGPGREHEQVVLGPEGSDVSDMAAE